MFDQKGAECHVGLIPHTVGEELQVQSDNITNDKISMCGVLVVYWIFCWVLYRHCLTPPCEVDVIIILLLQWEAADPTSSHLSRHSKGWELTLFKCRTRAHCLCPHLQSLFHSFPAFFSCSLQYKDTEYFNWTRLGLRIWESRFLDSGANIPEGNQV
jgi:hypothetical protein